MRSDTIDGVALKTNHSRLYLVQKYLSIEATLEVPVDRW